MECDKHSKMPRIDQNADFVEKLENLMLKHHYLTVKQIAKKAEISLVSGKFFSASVGWIKRTGSCICIGPTGHFQPLMWISEQLNNCIWFICLCITPEKKNTDSTTAVFCFPRPKKARMLKSKIKLILTVFFWDHSNFVSHICTRRINSIIELLYRSSPSILWSISVQNTKGVKMEVASWKCVN